MRNRRKESMYCYISFILRLFFSLFLFWCLTDCPVKFARVGCYRDSLINPRPIPELLMTDRDPTSHAYSGKPVDWKNWNEYLHDLVCRCAKKTRDKGYNVFGLQFYGKYIFCYL